MLTNLRANNIRDLHMEKEGKERGREGWVTYAWQEDKMAQIVQETGVSGWVNTHLVHSDEAQPSLMQQQRVSTFTKMQTHKSKGLLFLTFFQQSCDQRRLEPPSPSPSPWLDRQSPASPTTPTCLGHYHSVWRVLILSDLCQLCHSVCREAAPKLAACPNAETLSQSVSVPATPTWHRHGWPGDNLV